MNAPFSYSSPTLSVEALKHSIAYKLMFTIGKDPVIANKHEWLNATLFAVRDRMVERWLRSNRAQLSQETRQVYYLSMEFLIGRTLSNALLSLGIYDDVKNALEEMGLDLEELIDEENDPGLGNGGLGRLAACFLDSLATLALPGRGYGIRYDYGMFKQNIVDGRQKESPDYWLEYGNPWEFKRHNTRYKVRFGGRIQQEGKKTNTLRLWNAQASSEINLGKFNQGDYFAAVEDKNHSENVSRVLYPDDSTYSGRELRLRQEYFLVSATIQDILSRHYQLHKTYANLAEKTKKPPFTSTIPIRCCRSLS
ncbi:MAG: glycogen/starch/alpha-glucan phosphorylase [Enterobacter hormaechei]|nr:glycogen/starch/alpha-glucan phosphorylase [Enterobacter hormaechei]